MVGGQTSRSKAKEAASKFGRLSIYEGIEESINLRIRVTRIVIIKKEM